MRVLIAGIDGYIGWSLALRLVRRGHTVTGIDNLSRRKWVKEVGSMSAIPIRSFEERREMCQWYPRYPGDLTNHAYVSGVLEEFRPECLVYLGEQPSAPFSMKGVEHATATQYNNVLGTLVTLYSIKEHCPDCHLLKLGTMGEYGTPQVPIPEAGPHEFPRQPGSFYHASKVHDSVNVEFACRAWGIRSTDVMQGVVYGTRTDEIVSSQLATRLDIDECFGTAINRFCAQAVIGMPLTVYGKGGQTRGFLPLRDSIQCLTLAVECPPQEGEYRVFNQLEEIYSVSSLADTVKEVAATLGIRAEVGHVENPRVEMEEHSYKVDHQKLLDLGYARTNDLGGEIEAMLQDLLPNKDRIFKCRDALDPNTTWR